MEVVRSLVLAGFAASALSAADFSLTIGNPIAANVPKVSKSIGLAVRLENCADLSKASLTASAEGLVNGERQSVKLQVFPGSPPGAYGVDQTWSRTGTWVVNLTATCGSAKAGAIVPFRGAVYSRDSIKPFPRFATAAEVELSLKELAGGAQ
jgi:hypothetical protein